MMRDLSDVMEQAKRAVEEAERSVQVGREYIAAARAYLQNHPSRIAKRLDH